MILRVRIAFTHDLTKSLFSFGKVYLVIYPKKQAIKPLNYVIKVVPYIYLKQLISTIVCKIQYWNQTKIHIYQYVSTTTLKIMV